MLKAVIFDLDGLIADTEKLHYESYRQAFKVFGYELDLEVYEKHWIREGKTVPDYLRAHNIDRDPSDFRREKAGRYKALVESEVQAMPGAVELITSIYGRKLIALATSSYPWDAGAVIDTLGIRAYFHVIVTNADVENIKPAPDAFIVAAEKLGVPAKQCIVLEDSEKGVVAAKEAGMKVIAVPNAHTRNNDFSRADKVVTSLKTVTLQDLEALIS